jgi:hypothetical protein
VCASRAAEGRESDTRPGNGGLVAGRDAPLVFDAQKGMNGPPQGTVLPGKSITFPVAVSVGKEVADLVVDVTPPLHR